MNGDAIESGRQQALLALLAAPKAAADAPPGLHAYRTNAHASARRALGAACPTVLALLGEDDFTHLAREFWHADPPQRGDLAEWGEALPHWIALHPGLAEWPYLADCARLDLALHRCERAANAELDAGSLARLSDTEPARLRLCLRPGVAVLASAWPVASIHAAHAAGDQGLFELARERVLEAIGESVVVSRAGWRGVVHRAEPSALAFMRALLDEADLAQALDLAGVEFDFAAWLAEALRCHWMKGIERVAD